MKIFISVTDENLDFRAEVFTESFEVAEEKFGQVRRNYEKRVEMETKEETVNDF